MSNLMMPVGWDEDGRQFELPLSTVLKHSFWSGPTGSGKSFGILSWILQILTRFPHVNVTVLDGKGEICQLLLLACMVLAERHAHLAPDRITTIFPFGRWVPRLGLLHPIPGLPREAQCRVIAELLAGLADGGFGQRMNSTTTFLAAVVMDAGGGLHDLLRLLEDESYGQLLAHQVQDPDLRRYLLDVFPKELRATKDAVRSRLELALLIPEIRGMLCARGSLTGEELVNSRLVLADAATAPMGFRPLAHAIAAHLFALTTAGIFARNPATARPTLIVLDEFQVFCRLMANDLEMVLAQARSQRVGLMMACQTMAQVDAVSPNLTRCVLVNTHLHAFLQPGKPELAIVADRLPLLGHVQDPTCPDRCLTRAEEEQWRKARLGALPPRHGILVDRVTSGAPAVPFRTLSLPWDEMRRRAAACPDELRERYQRGAKGVPVAELVAETAQPTFLQAAGPSNSPSSPPPRPAARRPAKGRLVLPS